MIRTKIVKRSQRKAASVTNRTVRTTQISLVEKELNQKETDTIKKEAVLISLKKDHLAPLRKMTKTKNTEKNGTTNHQKTKTLRQANLRQTETRSLPAKIDLPKTNLNHLAVQKTKKKLVTVKEQMKTQSLVSAINTRDRRVLRKKRRKKVFQMITTVSKTKRERDARPIAILMTVQAKRIGMKI